MGTFERAFSRLLRGLVLAGAIGTGMIALWLCFVIVAVLPSRDPGRIPLWAGIAAAFLAYAALTLLFVLRAPRPPWLRGAVLWGSVAAVVFGACEIRAMVHAETGARFEGYLLLMGAILFAQGLCALAHVAVTAALARRVRAA